MRVIEAFVTSVPRDHICDNAGFFVQDWDDGLMCQYSENPCRGNSCWGGSGYISEFDLVVDDISSDAAETVVTREELMRAYDLVEQGYTLWFGGDCPAGAGGSVDIALRNGVHRNFPLGTSRVWSHSGGSSDIIAWRPNKSEDENPASKEPEISKDGSCTDDEVNHPPHYTSGNIECIDIIREMVRGKNEMEVACIANIVKYLYRYKDKGGIKSVEKAQWYLNLMIEEMKK